MPRKVRILSLDGGGIRGILPGIILADLEKRLQSKAGSKTRLADHFDLIAGTSTGGILTCGYLVPNAQEKPKYTAQEVLDIYLRHGGEIFNVSLLQSLRGMGGMIDEKYKADALEDELHDFFGDCRVGDLLKPCLITSYDIRNRRAVFFNKLDGVVPERNFFVRDVARATSAAPTYFETSMIRSELGVRYALIDGGVFANNPAMCAYSEARTTDFAEAFRDKNLPIRPGASNMMILSIGTGTECKPYHFDKAKDWGAVGWIQPLIDIMMSAAAETVNYHLKQVFDTIEEPDNYVRLDPGLLDAKPDMDDTTVDNMMALQQAGRQFVADNFKQLDEIADRLIDIGEA